MPPPPSKRHKGQIVHSEARTLVKNIIAVCEEERNENKLKFSLWRPMVRAAHYAGLSISTIKRIKSECKDGNEPSSPVRNQAGKKNFRMALPEKEMCAIRDEVQNYYLEHRNSPTSNKLLEFVQNRIAFKWKRETLRQILREMGFKWRKCGNMKQKILMEKLEYVSWRRNFITTIRELRNDGRMVLYMDEVWIDKALKLQRRWKTEKEESRGLDDKLILIHVGSEKGFLEGAELIYESRTDDCQNRFNGSVVEKWVTEKLLPKLSSPSVIVMDSSAHHCEAKYKRPSMYVPKALMVEWLRQQEVEFDENAPKGDLCNLIKSLKPCEKIYKIDAIFANSGHTVLRLPPHVCNLNAIELAWSKMETVIDENEIAGEFALEKLEALLRYSMESVTPEDWKQFVEMTVKVEDEYCIKDEQIETISEELMNQAKHEGDYELWANAGWSSSSDSDPDANW